MKDIKYTTDRKKDSLSELHPSAITDHVVQSNHTIDWEGVKFPIRDSDTTRRHVLESIAIHKTRAHTMNRDGGHHELQTMYSKLLSQQVPKYLVLRDSTDDGSSLLNENIFAGTFPLNTLS